MVCTRRNSLFPLNFLKWNNAVISDRRATALSLNAIAGPGTGAADNARRLNGLVLSSRSQPASIVSEFWTGVQFLDTEPLDCCRPSFGCGFERTRLIRAPVFSVVRSRAFQRNRFCGARL